MSEPRPASTPRHTVAGQPDGLCQCCGLPGANTHAVAAEGYAGTGCEHCASLAMKLGGHATRLTPRPASTPQHSEWIRCPKCGSEQRAVVLHTAPWWSYVHQCDCGYWIGESEWERVRHPAESNPACRRAEQAERRARARTVDEGQS